MYGYCKNKEGEKERSSKGNIYRPNKVKPDIYLKAKQSYLHLMLMFKLFGADESTAAELEKRIVGLYFSILHFQIIGGGKQ